MYNISILVIRSEDVKEYIESNRGKAPKFMERYESYVTEKEIITKIKRYSDKYIIFAFSGEWCKDCVRNIPVLARLQEETGLITRIFGHVMRDAKSSTKIWRVPPSPEEIELFNVTKIPSIYILNKNGEKVGEIIENPPPGKTLEAAILDILES
jgi:thiol-disulfide isomerase/thioredoxin